MDRTCEKYMSLLLSSDSRSSSNAAATAHIRRYEFVALIRWNNHALHDDLISTGVLLARVKSVQDAAKGKILQFAAVRSIQHIYMLHVCKRRISCN
jgi:hypothetical protein